MKIIRKYKPIIKKIASILTNVNRIIPKNPNKIVLYSNLGFRDNLKALFDYLVANNLNEKYTIICSTNDVKNAERGRIPNVKFMGNIAGLYHFLTAKYCFYCFGKYPIKPSTRQIVVNLWHGTPLKKIGNMETDQSQEDFNYFTYVLATSDYFRTVMTKAFKCSEANVLICGHPRNDSLFMKNDNFIQNKKLVLWLPTLRKSELLDIDNSITESPLPIFTDEDSITGLNRYLHDNIMYLIVKLHPIQVAPPNNIHSYSNLEILTHDAFTAKYINLYKILPMADALITDYSSVYFDYLLLDRPMGFTVEDFEFYTGKRGFVFENPLEYMPGYKIKTQDQFLEFLESINNNQDDYKEERKKVNDFANYYKDGNNCKRVLNLVGIC